MANCIIKVDDWKLEDNYYKAYIEFDNPNDEDVIVTLDVEGEDEFKELSSLLTDLGTTTTEGCTLVANDLPKKDLNLNIEFVSNLPGRLETILNSEGKEIVTYVEDYE